MTESKSLLPAITCAEDIALLQLLHTVPSQPSKNSVGELKCDSRGYTLSFAQEQSLAGILAFISSVEDDTDHITAVCIREDRKSSSLEVLLAVNRLHYNSGNVFLEKVERGFNKLFSMLKQVHQDTDSRRLQDSIFDIIISMDSARIFQRLRLTRGKRNVQRQRLKEVLQCAVNFIEHRSYESEQLVATSKLLISRAKEVIQLLDAHAKHQVPARLGALVEGIYRLRQAGDLKELLGPMPNTIMDPSLKKSLLNIIDKVARYREVPAILCHMAKKIPVMRNLRLTIAKLPREAFAQVSTNKYVPELRRTLSRVHLPKKFTLEDACRLLKPKEDVAENCFANQTLTTLKRAKIHAEVQLVFYCQQGSGNNMPPRIVCSSKDACFLCNLFVTSVAKMHTPRSHGKLYPQWRLPNLPASNEVMQDFNRVMEDYIRNSLRTLFARRQKTLYPHPNESTLITLYSSSSIAPSSGTSRSARGEQKTAKSSPNITRGDKMLEGLTPPHSSTNSLKKIIKDSTESVHAQSSRTLAVNPKCKQEDMSQNFPDQGSEPAMPSKVASVQPTDKLDRQMKLVQGQILSETINSDSTSPFYVAKHLAVQIVAPEQPNLALTSADRVRYSFRIEWLNNPEVQLLRVRRDASIVDLELIEGEFIHELDERGNLFVAARGTVIKLGLS
ncbi:uncharacterized protein PV09_02006 [Verruconis gallopava]|uniref:Uncharacterized protein n=1 Tax=Verruconis gallopava TaxID=253628 RepID=A0A0D2B7B2_9PEZI|nr:uncharacterized protein PV09_02006 [Verruconis gallopava]KIW07134.1 hypothetical protein PV09_02006 [Verruconis gallopava]